MRRTRKHPSYLEQRPYHRSSRGDQESAGFKNQRGFDYFDNFGYYEDTHEAESRQRQVDPEQIQPANPEVHDTPNPLQKRRKCRDVLCLGFFALGILTMLVAIGYVHLFADLARITNFYTTNGCDTCGKINYPVAGIPFSGKDLRPFPYGLVTLQHSNAVINTILDPTSITNLVLSSSAEFTTSDCVKTCPPETKTVWYRCVPLGNTTTAVFSSLQIIPQESNSDDDVFDRARTFLNELALDLQNTWKDIIILSFIGLGIAIAMTIFLRLFAGLIVWIVVLGISLSAIAGSAALWVIWFRLKDSESWSQGQLNGVLAGAIIASVCTILLILVFLVMRTRISLVVRLFNEAGKAIHSMPWILCQPIITCIVLVMALGLWLAVAVLIESAGISTLKLVQDEQYNFGRWWNLFIIFWLSQFIIGCQHLIISGAISTWFFTRHKSTLHFPILASFKRLIRFHLGSIAFGSLIIAIVKIVRYILTLIQNRLQNSSKIGQICGWLLCCCKCCIWCLEKFLIFLNRNAYIEIAIHGSGFCKSAQRAFSLIVKNALRMAAINCIGDFVLFLSKIGIVAITVGIGYELIKSRVEIHHIWVPLALAGISCFFIAHCFISVYEMAIDTIFICFCEDCEMNDGIQKPYFMSKGLMEFVKNSEKAIKQKKRVSG